MRTLVWAITLAVALAACGDDGGAKRTAPEIGVELSVPALLADTDVESIVFDILRDGVIAVSQAVPVTGEGSSAFFVLEPGEYLVRASFFDADGAASEDCAPTERPVTIAADEVNALVLVTTCGGEDNGGLDVEVEVNSPPVIRDVAFDPGNRVEVCDETALTATADDADDDPLTFAWTLDVAEAVHLAEAGSTAIFSADRPGTYDVHLEVTDGRGGRDTFDVPVVVRAGDGCEDVGVVEDLVPPGGVSPAAVVTDLRRAAVELSFTAPGDDGDVGARVVSYEVRQSDTAIEDEAGWNAAITLDVFPATADPGAVETLQFERRLQLNETHAIAIRATDDAGLVGDFGAVVVDLRLRSATFAIAPQNAADWGPRWDFSVVNEASMVRSAGDVNADGRGDLVAGMYWLPDEPPFYPERWNTSVVLGAADPAAASVVTLEAPIVDGEPLDGQGIYVTGVGDLNGDGFADLAAIGFDQPISEIAFGIAPTWKTAVAIYFGTADPAALAVPDSVILMTDRQGAFVAGVGNFNHLAADGGTAYDDLVIGGDNMPGTSTNLFVVAGRATVDWPPEIELGVLDASGGVTELTVPETRAGRFITGAGDLDGDGLDDIAFSAGGGFNHVYVFAGQAPLAVNYAYDVGNFDTVKLAHPCPSPDPGNLGAFGSDFAGGRDLDGDGRSDFVVGDRTLQQLIPYSAVNPVDETLADLANTDCAKTSYGLFGSSFDVAGDIDGDGDLDLVATHQDSDPTVTESTILYNNGEGVFGHIERGGNRTADVVLDSGLRQLGVAGLGDFDGDGDDDVGAIVKQPDGNFEIMIYY